MPAAGMNVYETPQDSHANCAAAPLDPVAKGAQSSRKASSESFGGVTSDYTVLLDSDGRVVNAPDQHAISPEEQELGKDVCLVSRAHTSNSVQATLASAQVKPSHDGRPTCMRSLH